MKRILLSLALVTSLSACAAMPTPYQEATGSRWGYEENQIERNRFRVSFGGNSLTDRETVELYLLYRSAELTVEQGYDYFELVERAVDSETRTLGRHPRYGGFSVRYAYFHPRWGWRGLHDPFWDDFHEREITRFEASAEIVMGNGDKPDHSRAFDARDVMANLGDDIVRPEAE
ncbi:MAG: hypothetical protein JJ884_08850 [Maricaulis sp.]|uniref:CC0125/CC1285 family lipoprotein n=1 Tax=Maricaulis sp. TaxID=1486257 RepID=UPI001B24E02D|nr:hypothetical protein [Maricaulis sp.]MBO6728818.1 hypothetical protein [Maricaulis sp.]MBO6847614.1 hypothetical protein [Maricaulis sp.]MBO6876959.1 hypothetical protein [Maricaulis sp.]